MDIHKQSTGDIDRKEDEIDNLSPNEFWEYLREVYEDNDVGQTGTLKYQYGIKRDLSENVFVITIPFSAFDMVYAGKHYKLAQRLYLKINNNTYKYEDVLISNNDPKTKETLVKNDYGFEEQPKATNSRVCPPEGKTMTNRMIIDIIDLLLSNTEFPMLKRR